MKSRLPTDVYNKIAIILKNAGRTMKLKVSKRKEIRKIRRAEIKKRDQKKH